MNPLQGPKGAPDILPPRSTMQEHIAHVATEAFRRFGYQRIDTPAFEHTEVFLRGLAEHSEIVTKEMYTFEDKGGRSLTLRPDMTAPVVRSVIENNLDKAGLPVKLYYIASVFRHERPQAGRQRVFTQAGVEALGSAGPRIDAEVIELAQRVYEAVGLPVRLLLNSIGHPQCRATYLPSLVAFLEGHRDDLCSDCQRKIDRNPLRTFDCKVESDREIMRSAPLITDFLCADCKEHYDEVKQVLGVVGVTYEEEPRLVRGLDYYTRTTFEFVAAGLGSQDSVGAGGRYDGLSEQLGGAALPGIGFGLGIDRIALALAAAGAKAPNTLDVFIIAASGSARPAAFSLASRLRREGWSAELDHLDRGVKAQFKAADRAGARVALIIGDRELAGDMFTVRDMHSGDETTVAAEGLSDLLKGKVT